ncbi:MAG: cytoplasmic protein [Solirubrobacteraceae bacterium]|nr:cytoplasmic protein [Solirubrobacteraceae bacterium]
MPGLADRFAVDPEIHARWPDYRAHVLCAEGLAGGPSDDESRALLARAAESLLARGLARAADHPHVAAWRAAFSAFGSKPSRYPCSAEALAARVLKGRGLPEVNRLVDAYNAVSVAHLIPVGGEDAGALRGTLRLTVAAGDEPFEPRDGEAPETVDPGEVVWGDDAGVTCRRWNWRQGRRTQIGEGTTSAVFVFDALGPCGDDELRAAVAELRGHLAAWSPGARFEVVELPA